MQSPEDRAMYKEVKEASVSLEPRDSEGRTVRELWEKEEGSQAMQCFEYHSRNFIDENLERLWREGESRGSFIFKGPLWLQRGERQADGEPELDVGKGFTTAHFCH